MTRFHRPVAIAGVMGRNADETDTLAVTPNTHSVRPRIDRGELVARKKRMTVDRRGLHEESFNRRWIGRGRLHDATIRWHGLRGERRILCR